MIFERIAMTSDEKTDLRLTIAPIITSTYGQGSMAHDLIDHLTEKIADYEGPNLSQMILNTCWNWFPGGSTAAAVTARIEDVLFAHLGC